MFTQGRRVWTPEFGWVRYERPLVAEADTSYDSKFRKVRTSTILLDASEGAIDVARADRANKKIASYEPELIEDEIVDYLRAHNPPVEVRFSWPTSADAAFRMKLEELGITLPENARPMDSGKFGGKPMYAPSSEVYGLEDEDFPTKGTLPFALKLAKEGFSIHVATTV
jgi:hypothetical protein